MAQSNFVFFAFVTLASFFIGHGLALDSEFVHGGHFALPESIKYHVGILGRPESTAPYTVICGGSIIHDLFVLSAIRCFLNAYLQIVDILYSVAVNTTDFNRIKKSQEIPINTIYTSLFDADQSLNDIAILKLNHSLKIDENPSLAKVSLPSPYESFAGRYGVVTGFGCAVSDASNSGNSGKDLKHKRTFSLNIRGNSREDMTHRRTLSTLKETEVDDVTSTIEQTSEGTEVLNNMLKYGIVRILHDTNCTVPRERNKQFFGTMISNKPGQKTGICRGDTGNPLVVENTLVGIISEGPADCSDPVAATKYTPVSYFMHLIRLVLKNDLTQVPYSFYNGQHITHIRL